MSILVSIIIPCFNVEKYIEDCLTSVAHQTYKNVEVICIDNNSSDSTWEVLNSLKKRYPDLILHKELNAGGNAARNKGLSVAKGEWIQFLDADDLLEPEKISHQVELVKNIKNNESFIAACYKNRDIDGNIKDNCPIEENKFISVFKNQCGITSSNLWKKQTIDAIGGWDVNLFSSQEADLMLRLILFGAEYVCDNEPLTIICERPSGQVSQSDPVLRWKRYIQVKLDFLEKLKEIHPEEYQKNIGFYYDSLMVTILVLSQYDTKEGEYYYSKYIKNQWKSSYSIGFSFLKVIMIKTLGLKQFIRLQNVGKKYLTIKSKKI